MKVKVINKFGCYLVLGFDWHRFAIGFSVSQYSIDLDLGFIWIVIEK
jgi:hypothetical protein